MSNDTESTTVAKRPARSARVGTVVWGFILIGIAALFFVIARFDLSQFNAAIVVTWAVLGVGALAILGGLVGALVRRR